MYSASDFEKLWFLYKTDGEPQGLSINDFCLRQGVPYHEFNKWFRKTHKAVVPVKVEGMPGYDDGPDDELSDMELSQSKLSNNKRSSGGILVSIQTRDGLHIRSGNLDYRGLVALVEKLEGLC